jgi:hypothetical protein
VWTTASMSCRSPDSSLSQIFHCADHLIRELGLPRARRSSPRLSAIEPPAARTEDAVRLAQRSRQVQLDATHADDWSRAFHRDQLHIEAGECERPNGPNTSISSNPSNTTISIRMPPSLPDER